MFTKIECLCKEGQLSSLNSGCTNGQILHDKCKI